MDEGSEHTENASLQDFHPAEDGDRPPSALPEAGDHDAAATLATSVWTSQGRPCPACEATATRLWVDGDRLVCPACKDWE